MHICVNINVFSHHKTVFLRNGGGVFLITWKTLYLMSLISTSLLGLPSGPEDASRVLNLKENMHVADSP